MEVRNRFKELDLVDRVPEELWEKVHDIVQEAVIKRSRPSTRKRNAKRQNSCLRSPYKWLRKEKKLKAKERSKAIPFEYKCRVSKNSMER